MYLYIHSFNSRGWYIDSSSGSTKVTLQKQIGSSELISIMIRAHREGDIRRLGQETELRCLHCIHNIDSSESHISKQFVYTISSILFWFILHAYIAVNTDKLAPQMVQMDGVFDVDVDDPSLYSRALYSGRPFSSLPETVSQE